MLEIFSQNQLERINVSGQWVDWFVFGSASARFWFSNIFAMYWDIAPFRSGSVIYFGLAGPKWNILKNQTTWGIHWTVSNCKGKSVHFPQIAVGPIEFLQQFAFLQSLVLPEKWINCPKFSLFIIFSLYCTSCFVEIVYFISHIE